jgi:hypothetical protein
MDSSGAEGRPGDPVEVAEALVGIQGVGDVQDGDELVVVANAWFRLDMEGASPASEVEAAAEEVVVEERLAEDSTRFRGMELEGEAGWQPLLPSPVLVPRSFC